jgi:hypothetical protein
VFFTRGYGRGELVGAKVQLHDLCNATLLHHDTIIYFTIPSACALKLFVFWVGDLLFILSLNLSSSMSQIDMCSLNLHASETQSDILGVSSIWSANG